ncbi:hypothetical protein HMPREF9104_01090, partial [Lentilactobacillus kisonensis F0435]
ILALDFGGGTHYMFSVSFLEHISTRQPKSKWSWDFEWGPLIH